jgi:hypothetical protein
MTTGRKAALAFAAGGALLFFAESLVPQLLGVVVLLGAIALGTFAIATPEFLSGDAPGEGDD